MSVSLALREGDGELAVVGRFGRRGIVGRDGDFGRVDVRIGDRHVISVHPVVIRVAAGRGSCEDCVGDITVQDVVVFACDDDGLWRVPVRWRKRHAGRGDRAFAGIAGRDADGDVGGGWGIEDHIELGGSARFRGDQSAGRVDGDSGWIKGPVRVVTAVGVRSIRGFDHVAGTGIGVGHGNVGDRL